MDVSALEFIEDARAATYSIRQVCRSVSVAAEPTGKFAYATKFDGNNVSPYPIKPITGVLAQITGWPWASEGEGSQLGYLPKGTTPSFAAAGSSSTG